MQSAPLRTTNETKPILPLKPDWLISCSCMTSVLKQEQRKLHFKWVCLEDAKPYLVFTFCKESKQVFMGMLGLDLALCWKHGGCKPINSLVMVLQVSKLYGSSWCNSPAFLCVWIVDYRWTAFVKRPESLGGCVQGRTALDYVDTHATT